MRAKGTPSRVALTWRDARRRAVIKGLYFLHRRSDRATLWYTPDIKPIATSLLRLIAAELGMRLGGTDGIASPLIVWDTGTVCSRSYPGAALNTHCRDISKTTVDKTFAAVFGYGAIVDPFADTGQIVEKSDENATHDGRVLQSPIAAIRKGAVYTRLIDNRVADGLVEDIRVPVILGHIPFVYLKQRSLAIRFSNENSSASMQPADVVLTRDEQAKLVAFAEAMGMQFGELDVLRDKSDGRIYVVDANRTPAGPPNHLRRSDYFPAVRSIAATLRDRWLDGLVFASGGTTAR
jgi:hypothetical protein